MEYERYPIGIQYIKNIVRKPVIIGLTAIVLATPFFASCKTINSINKLERYDFGGAAGAAGGGGGAGGGAAGAAGGK